MSAKQVVTERQLFRWMSPEQRKEWREAKRTGGNTFFYLGAPDSGSDGTWVPSYDVTWYACWHGVCFDVCDGEPCAVDWSCDTDGNWDYSVRCTLREYTDNEADRDAREAAQAYSDYMRHCLETGDDPLSDFFVRHTRKVRERWTLEFKPSILGMILTRARRGRHTWTQPEHLPRYVLDYAKVDCRNPSRPVATWKREDVKLTRTGRHTKTIERDVPRNPARIRADIRRIARRYLRVEA